MRRSPSLHFVAIGALLFAATRWTGGGAAALPIALDARRVDALRQSWMARTGQSPTDQEWQLLQAEALDEEALYRTALAAGLERDDPVVQRRILTNMQFVSDTATDATALYRDAQRLGFADTDLIVRRRLIERMRRWLEAPGLTREPTDAELHAYLDAHADQFSAPARVRLTQIFLSRQRRGVHLERDARRLLDELTPADANRADLLADPLPLSAELDWNSSQDLARAFGSEFAAAAFAADPGHWHGPVQSVYGVHLLWIHERTPVEPPALDSVRSAVRAALLEERAAAALRSGVRQLRSELASQ